MIRMPKLTLSVNDEVVARATRYAAARGTSVSRLVESMLDLLATVPRSGHADPPILAKLRGSLRRASVRDYRAYLVRKHR